MSLWLDMLGTTIRFVETESFGTTRIAEAGMEHDKTLLFMHGIGGHLEAYARNIAALSDEFHTVAYDYVGHGLSNKMEMDYSPLVLVEHLAELMDALQIERAHLCGESLGGWVAGHFARLYPQRIDRLILNTSAGLPIITDKGRAELQDLIDLSRKATGHGPPTYESIENRMKWLFHPNNHHMISDELINTRLTLYSQPVMKDVAPRVLAMIPAHDDFLIPLAEIKCDTLFLWTEDNPVQDVETARRSSAQVPGSLLYVMKKDSAHWPQYEAPEEFNRVVRQFLADGTI